ncbi:uncharacterized [Tachysurus ichikawai]
MGLGSLEVVCNCFARHTYQALVITKAQELWQCGEVMDINGGPGSARRSAGSSDTVMLVFFHFSLHEFLIEPNHSTLLSQPRLESKRYYEAEATSSTDSHYVSLSC